ncbi:MAG: UbiD family decarboxylase [Syntrophales bacterium]|nr:UbiD family decarboxylase [Syntrophales bacterium]
MAYRNLKEFVDKLEEAGEIKKIKVEVDWRDEIAAVGKEAVTKDSPALIFENIKDYKKTPGKKVALNLLSSFQRMSLALGLNKDTKPKELLNVYRERIRNPIKPMLVSTGSCKEIVKKGKDINIFDFPIIKINPNDGGRYSVWQCCITKDPETGWINVGMYNSMLYEKDAISVSPVRTQHMAIHGRKYHAINKPMPYAIAIGCEPLTMMVGCAPFKPGVNEFDMAGALRREPVEMVKCETVDLEVPANSEIVIEGTVNLDPNTYREEGPFGRYTGHYTSLTKKNMAPVLKISCISYKNDPLYWTIPGVPGPNLSPSDGEYACQLQMCAILWNHLEASGIEGLTGVWTDTDTFWTNVFVSINKTHYGHAKQIAAQIWGSQEFTMVGKFVVVVDSDVDIFNLKKINAAIAHRTRGARDITIYPNTLGSPLDPSNEPGFVNRADIGSWDRVLIDATWPFEWEPREEWGGLKYPPKALTSPEVLEKVKNRWTEYGL